MRRVREEIGSAIGKRPHVTIAFNVAPEHFDDALILNDVGTIFDSSPVKLTQIVLELTERSRIENLSGMRDTVAALQGMGCKVAIDDMGNDHCGLSYVLKLGVDIIKIDKIIVQSIDTKSDSKTTIETLIDLAKNMGMDIVAEGVETFDQVTYLRERGITAAQGYVFAPPLPSSLVPAIARRHGPGRRSRSGDAGAACRRSANGSSRPKPHLLEPPGPPKLLRPRPRLPSLRNRCRPISQPRSRPSRPRLRRRVRPAPPLPVNGSSTQPAVRPKCRSAWFKRPLTIIVQL